VIADLPAPPATVVAILRDFAPAIGTGVGSPSEIPPGMIGGQVVDIESEGLPPTAELVERIHRAKTGALLTSSIVCGGLLGLAHAPQAYREMDCTERLRSFGKNFGLAFQIIDDILDMTQTSAELGKTAGKDLTAVKATWPAVYGIERSRADADALIADAFAALEPFAEAGNPLKALARFCVERRN
jgi:geranylgeranyl diphosphate synthase type II